jgi:SufS family cysteine desulfurase
MNQFDPLAFRQCFPFFNQSIKNNSSLYFDSAATTQKPQTVIDTLSIFYQYQNANVHRGAYQLSAKATAAFEQARTTVKEFINAASHQEIIWTKGTTEAINLVATSWGLTNLRAGDEIVISYAEHHANIVPWQNVAKLTGATIKVLPLTKKGLIDTSQIATIITTKTRLVCCNHVSNVIGKFNDLRTVITHAKKVGAITLIDGAQAVAHQSINVQNLGCDFYVFSAHKAYGPMGIGVLYGKKHLLSAMPPYQFGGEMIKQVAIDTTTFNELPFKFEAGTPNVAGAIAFAQAIKFMTEFMPDSKNYEQQLVQYCYKSLSEIPQLTWLTEGCPDVGIFSFTIENMHNHDVATALDSVNVGVRNGHHCAMPLMAYLNVSGCIRVSLSAYNTYAEVDRLVEILQRIIKGEVENIEKNKVKDKVNANANANAVIKTNLQNNYSTSNIIELFKPLRSWDSRHRQIMLLSKNLPKLPPEKCTQSNVIAGCESLAWLDYTKNKDKTFIFEADSEAKVIRGLLVIVLAAYQYKTAEQIIAFNIEQYFNVLGLTNHLSPSRSNGLKAIVDKINHIVSQH